MPFRYLFRDAALAFSLPKSLCCRFWFFQRRLKKNFNESEWFIWRRLLHTSQNGSSRDVCSTRERTKSQNSSKMPCNVLDVICKESVQQHYSQTLVWHEFIKILTDTGLTWAHQNTHWHWSDMSSSEYSLTLVWHELISILIDTGPTWTRQHTYWHWSDMNSSAFPTKQPAVLCACLPQWSLVWSAAA